MDLSKIISVSGKPGLFKIISSGKNAIIVESFLDKKKIPVYTSNKVSSLDEISIYTVDEDVPLKKVFAAILAKEGEGKPTSVSHKESNDIVKDYFESILPTYDKENVFISDMKKVIQWYNMLLAENLIMPLTEEEEMASVEKQEVASE